jgi:6-phosphofructokinase 1
MSNYGNAVIGLGGGPTSVINETLVATIFGLNQWIEKGNIWVMANGIDSIDKNVFYDAKRHDTETLRQIAQSTGAAPGSTRTNPKKKEGLLERTLDTFKKNDVHYFFYIGGNDTAEAAEQIRSMAERDHYDLTVMHIPKTIDCDLVENDHTPGYGSAARYVAIASMGNALDAVSIPSIKIDIVMGRHAGFLTAASVLAKQGKIDYGPHLIYVPESPVTLDRIMGDIELVYNAIGWCHVALSEGVEVPNKKPGDIRATRPLLEELTDYLSERGFSLNISDELRKDIFKVDAFGHPELSAYSFLGDFLAIALKTRSDKLKKARMRAQTLGYTQRGFFDSRSETDVHEARLVGQVAAVWARTEKSGSVTLQRTDSGHNYQVSPKLVDLPLVAGKTRLLDPRYITDVGITQDFVEWVKPLVGKIPEIGRFSVKTALLK